MPILGLETLSWLSDVEGKWLCIRGPFYDKYCIAELNGIRCNSPIASNRHKWKITKARDSPDTIMLQTARNMFYCDNQRLNVKCQTNDAGQNNWFKVHYKGQNQFVLRGMGGGSSGYCADEGTNVKCDYMPTEFNGRELFKIDTCHVHVASNQVYVPQSHMYAVIGSMYWAGWNTQHVTPIDTIGWVIPPDASGKKQCRECLPKAAIHSMTSNVYGNSIAVGCCELNGSTGSHTATCTQAQTWYEADEYCKQQGKRLCSDEEIERGFMQYTSCGGFPALLHWTNTPCYYATPIEGDAPESGNTCITEPYFYAVLGDALGGINPAPGMCPAGWAGVCPKQPVECRPTTEFTSVTANAYGNALGVTCCSYDGTGASRGECKKARTWYEAFTTCAEYDMRLCSMQEIEDGMGRGSGCEFDYYLNWTQTPCYNPTPCCGDNPGTYIYYDQIKHMQLFGGSSANTLVYGTAALEIEQIQKMRPMNEKPCID